MVISHLLAPLDKAGAVKGVLHEFCFRLAVCDSQAAPMANNHFASSARFSKKKGSLFQLPVGVIGVTRQEILSGDIWDPHPRVSRTFPFSS
jgi:hypothetical protein